MSFVRTQPEALAAAAGRLQQIGLGLHTENAAGVTPTTSLAPAGTDEVSILTAAQFAAHGSVYQAVAARADAIHETFAATLKSSALSYAETEAANAAVTTPSGLAGLFQNFLANASVNGVASLTEFPMIAAINSAGTAGAFLPSTLIPTTTAFFSGAGFNAVGGGTIGSGLGALLAPGGPLSNLGALGGGAVSGAAASASSAGWSAPTAVSASVGQASLVGKLAVPPSWATATPSAATSELVHNTSWAPPTGENSISAIPPGIPAGAGHVGYGASGPRYGFTPTVMPRPVMVG